MKVMDGSPISSELEYMHNLRGLSPRDAMTVLGAYPTLQLLRAADGASRSARLGTRLAKRVETVLERSETLAAQWGVTVARCAETGVRVVPLRSHQYPRLLRRIPDPPPLLFVRGSLEALGESRAVAVVGTREPSERGREVAFKVAKHFASCGFTIISGLAQGIDTSAHLGALEAGGRTVAVLGTAADRIYPAVNAALAQCILAQGGALVSEHAPDEHGGKAAFVRRDRIQSGLSLGVVAVQTDVTGGTMHTVGFAEQHGRLLLAPRPGGAESQIRQYAGIRELIASGRARAFDATDYDAVAHDLDALLGRLESAESARTTPPSGDGSPPPAVQIALLPQMRTRVHKEPVLDDLVALCRECGLDQSGALFDEVIAGVRSALFPDRAGVGAGAGKGPLKPRDHTG